MSDADIPGLPTPLRRVPGPRPHDPTWREDWFAWRDDLAAFRDGTGDYAWRTKALATDAGRDIEKRLCAADPAYFVAVWARIFEPRKRKGETADKPFAPFAFQVDLLRWLDVRMEDEEHPDGFVTKARGLGGTWVFCAYALHGWLFREPWSILLVSHKEAKVDMPNNTDSMFGMIEHMLTRLPTWMLPPGYEHKFHRLRMSLRNPHSGALLRGESTSTRTARGSRSTAIFYDEAAAVEHFADVFATGAGTTDHRFPLSTENFEFGDDWWRLWQTHRATPALKELDWWLNPYQDAAWFEKERLRYGHDTAKFAREVERNPWAEQGVWLYPEIRDRPLVPEGFDPSRPLLVGIDPGFADPTGIVFANLIDGDLSGRMRWVDSFQEKDQPAEYFAHILTGIPPAIGDVCHGATFSARALEVMAWTRDLPWTGPHFCMDPAGGNKDTSGQSFQTRLFAESFRLRQRRAKELAEAGAPAPRPQGIAAYHRLFTHRMHEQRQLATHEMLRRSDFSDTFGGRALKDALGRRRYQRSTLQRTTEAKPVHDEYSHLGTAAEYAACYAALGVGGPKKKQRPARKERVQWLSWGSA